MSIYRISNMHDTTIWEGNAMSFYEAWLIMFKACKYPSSEWKVSKAIDSGLWIEKITK